MMVNNTSGSSTSKVGRYLRYAIGEIVLVVIGILIALSINNWNQAKIAERQAYSYLKQISNDLETDIKVMDIVIEDIEEITLSIENAAKDNFQNDSLLLLMSDGITRNHDQIEFARSYTGFVNSGAIEEIDNNEVVSEIHNYYLMTCRTFNNMTGYHKSLNLQKLEGEMVSILERNPDGSFKLESLKRAIESENLVSLIYWQNSFLEAVCRLAKKTKKDAQELHNLLQAFLMDQ